MIICMDVGYRDDGSAKVAAVVIDDWASETVTTESTLEIDQVAAYVPGEFYRREMPCLLAMLESLSITPEVIVIDGFVTLNGDGRAGLGMHLYDHLRTDQPSIAVVGVAKTAFHGATHAIEVLRGDSVKPLFVTSVGIDAQSAADSVRTMAGNHRFPQALSRVDQLTKP